MASDKSASGPQGMVIVGAGECGIRAAMALREEGYGGPVTLIGAEPHLPYERPPLSKAVLLGDDAPSPKTIANEARLFEAAVLHLSSVTATGIDREAKSVSLSNGRGLHYSKLLLATGADPRPYALAEGLSHVFTLRTFDDALAIRSRLGPGCRLAIIGGGFIGLELAAAARTRRADVTVIEAAPRILGRAVPTEIAQVIHARHAREGVRILVGAAIADMKEQNGGILIKLQPALKDEAGPSAVQADLVVVGIGAQPNTALAEAAGLTVENGIAVDAHLRTSDPDIFAAGDCCSFPLAYQDGRRVRLEAWRNAQEQGTLAARNMLGGRQAHVAVPWFWSDQYDLGLQMAGLADRATQVVRRDLGSESFLLFHLDAEGRLVAASGIGPGTSIARDIRLAEMMIARGARPDPLKLANAESKLKALLAA
ncbi:FAD-dependent oxidoreductase [Mesorhizobium sp. RP14(2022)]|uniref:FAD-dependent oxidoreductase n=1 Tax=Mesorhizobium liriopis TaxID=2953882 RepID=A0ABT1C2I9_9HYPH|nr:FAD-dependent oxidoreductase [Mesorhizobium liriopis]MCO6049034.1 FAD-dependent oxidoreductase [Mesorhizobium liriopis]